MAIQDATWMSGVDEVNRQYKKQTLYVKSLAGATRLLKGKDPVVFGSTIPHPQTQGPYMRGAVGRGGCRCEWHATPKVRVVLFSYKEHTISISAESSSLPGVGCGSHLVSGRIP